MTFACFVEADLRYPDAGAPADRVRAVAQLEPACAGGVIESCFLLGRIRLARRDVPGALQAFTRAAVDPGVRREAALRLIDKHRLAEAEGLMSAACDAGDREACESEGRLLVILGRRIDHAVALLLEACDHDGSRKACRALAHVYAQRRQGALARTYFERGQSHSDAAYRASIARAAKRKGSVADGIVFWASVICPPLALLALPHATEYGYGFEEQRYGDP